MFAKTKAIALIIDGNLADIEHFETAWSNAGHDQSIGLYSCTSCEEALVWLHEEIPEGWVVTGVLVDLMLVDSANRPAIDVLSALPFLKDVPVISWSGVDVFDKDKNADRIRKSASRVWTKPQAWTAWSDFVRRFFNVLDRRSTTSSSRFPDV